MRASRGCSGSRFMRAPIAVTRPSRTAPSASSSASAASSAIAGRARRTTRTSADRRPTRGCRARRPTRSTRWISGSPCGRRRSARVPQAAHAARTRGARRARRAASAESAGMRSSSSESMPAIRIVARDLVEAGVDDGRDAGHRQRRLGDVGGEDHAAAVDASADRRVLLVGRAASRAAARRRRRTDRGATSCQRAIDLAGARQEARARCPCVSRSSSPRPRATGWPGAVVDLERMQPARHVDDAGSRRGTPPAAPASSVADMTTIRRSSRARHACRASASPRSAWTLRSWNSSRTMVRKPLEQRILLQARRQDAFGREQHARVAP